MSTGQTYELERNAEDCNRALERERIEWVKMGQFFVQRGSIVALVSNRGRHEADGRHPLTRLARGAA